MNLFLAMTPYHLLLARLCDAYSENDFIVFVDQFGRFGDGEQLRQLARTRRWIFLTAPARSLGRLVALNKMLSAVVPSVWRDVARELRAAEFNQVFVFNDSAYEIQYLLSQVRARGIVYMEDGAAPYNDHQLRRTAGRNLAAKILLGGYVDPCRVLGTSRYVQGSVLSFPELARCENKSKPHRQLQLASSYEATLREIAAEMVKPVLGPLHERSALLILPRVLPGHFDLGASERLIRSARDRFKVSQVLLKMHPLDSAKGLNVDGDIVLLPNHLPVEVVPASTRSVIGVLGSKTTALLSMRLFYPSLHLVGVDDRSDPLLGIYRKLGICLVPHA